MLITSFSYFLLFVILNKSSCEDFNLYGGAGQAYSLEIEIGHPPQKLNVLIDTGSTTLAIASYPIGNSNIYFNAENSSSIIMSNQEVSAQYSQGSWVGHLVLDYVKIPSITSIPEVRCELALIKVSKNFFIKGSKWQGLLGLAFLSIGAWGDDTVAGSWLDSVEEKFDKAMSFQLKLCGVMGPTNATHYGNLEILEDSMELSHPVIYKTPILQRRWYEIGVLSIRVLNAKSPNATKTMNNTTSDSDHYKDMCLSLNKEKSIVDSGTTNIRLPDVVFREVVKELKSAAASDILILDEFWYHGEAACWPDPQEWLLPSIAIDLLSTEADNQYFTLEITPQNYIRVLTAQNNKTGSVPMYCYKLGLEVSTDETILGYTAMEGFEVLFNRSAGWIGWHPSNCGPNVRITGPYNYSSSLRTLCKLAKDLKNTEISIIAAQWALCGISILAAGFLIYLLAPVIRMTLMRLCRHRLPLARSQQISLSQAALVEQEN